MKYEKPKYEFPIEWRDWCTGAGQPAGIWWLEGRTYFAGFGSLAEAKLAELGAFQVATLQFEPDPLEGRRAGRQVMRVPPGSLIREDGATPGGSVRGVGLSP